MAAKSVIDIDIHDDKFQNFLEKFAEFQKAIGDIPAAWQGITQGAEAVAQETKKSAETTEAIAENTEDAAEATKELAENTGEAAKAENQLARARNASGRFIKASADSAAAVAESTTDAADATKALADNTDKVVKAEGRLARARAAVGRFFKSSAEGAGEVTDNTDKSAKAAQKFNKETDKVRKNLNKANKDSKSFATHIKDATSSLLTWGGVLGMFSGLAGVGSLWGLSHLARDAGAQRFTAMGLGTTAGGLNASSVDYQAALGNPVGTLGAIRDAQLDLSKRWQFQAMGVGSPDQDPAKLLPKMIKAARDIFVRNGSTQQGAEAYGLTNFFSLDDLNRFKKMRNAEIDAMAKQADKDAQKLQLTDQQLKQWQEFNVQLDLSKISIENAFIKGLGPLTPALAKLSDSVADAVQSFLESPEAGALIADVSKELKTFSDYLSSGAMRKDFDDFMASIREMGVTVDNVVKFLKGDTINGWMDASANSANSFAEYVKDKSGWDPRSLGRGVEKNLADNKKYEAFFEEAANKYGVDPKMLKVLAHTESSMNPNALGPVTRNGQRAEGVMQVMPGNFKPGEQHFDPHDNIMAGARIWKDAVRWANAHGGGTDEALRYYNGGTRRGSKENREYPDRAREQYKKYYGTDMPGAFQPNLISPPADPGSKVTNQLLQQIVDQHKHGGAQAIVIHNNTGGNAVVSSTQLGGFG
jgi:methyl-accepting chemotaxis protein